MAAAWLGHANPHITMKIYTHSTGGAAERVSESDGRVVTLRDNEPPSPKNGRSSRRKAG